MVSGADIVSFKPDFGCLRKTPAGVLRRQPKSGLNETSADTEKKNSGEGGGGSKPPTLKFNIKAKKKKKNRWIF